MLAQTTVHPVTQQIINRDLHVCVAFMDLPKASDSLDHIISWLSALELHGTCLWVICLYVFNIWGMITHILVRGWWKVTFLMAMLLVPCYIWCKGQWMLSHSRLLQYADDSALIYIGSSLNIVHEYLSQDLSHQNNNTEKSSGFNHIPICLKLRCSHFYSHLSEVSGNNILKVNWIGQPTYLLLVRRCLLFILDQVTEKKFTNYSHQDVSIFPCVISPAVGDLCYLSQTFIT